MLKPLLHRGQLGLERGDLVLARLAVRALRLSSRSRFGLAVAAIRRGERREQAKRFLEEAGSEYIGVYFDVGNFVPWAFPEHWIEMLGSAVKKVHFKDFRRKGHQFVPLLEGDVDWPAVMKALRGVGYSSDVIQEVAGDEAGMKATAEAMRKIVAM